MFKNLKKLIHEKIRKRFDDITDRFEDNRNFRFWKRNGPMIGGLSLIPITLALALGYVQYDDNRMAEEIEAKYLSGGTGEIQWTFSSNNTVPSNLDFNISAKTIVAPEENTALEENLHAMFANDTPRKSKYKNMSVESPEYFFIPSVADGSQLLRIVKNYYNLSDREDVIRVNNLVAEFNEKNNPDSFVRKTIGKKINGIGGYLYANKPLLLPKNIGNPYDKRDYEPPVLRKKPAKDTTVIISSGQPDTKNLEGVLNSDDTSYISVTPVSSQEDSLNTKFLAGGDDYTFLDNIRSKGESVEFNMKYLKHLGILEDTVRIYLTSKTNAIARLTIENLYHISLSNTSLMNAVDIYCRNNNIGKIRKSKLTDDERGELNNSASLTLFSEKHFPYNPLYSSNK